MCGNIDGRRHARFDSGVVEGRRNFGFDGGKLRVQRGDFRATATRFDASGAWAATAWTRSFAARTDDRPDSSAAAEPIAAA